MSSKPETDNVREVSLAPHHCFEALGERLLLHIGNSLYYRVNNVVFDLVRAADCDGWNASVTRIRRRYRAGDVRELSHIWTMKVFWAGLLPHGNGRRCT